MNPVINTIVKTTLGALFCSTLLFLNPADITASGVVFGGKVVAMIPSSICADPLTAASCVPCGLGTWDNDLIAPVYGTAPGSVPFICQTVGVPAFGTAPVLIPGATVFGSAPTPWLFSNDGLVFNVWGQWQ